MTISATRLPEAPAAVAAQPELAPLNRAFARQKTAFGQQPEGLPLAERLALLQSMEQLLMKHRVALADAMSQDFSGRPRAESLLELFVSIDDLRHAQKRVRRWAKPRRAAANWQFWPSRGQLRPQALGVVGVLGAFNYPVMTALSPAIGALAAGNRVIIKPSDQMPATTALLKSLFEQTFSPEVLAIVDGDLSVSQAFGELHWDHLVFTGSTRVGRLVATAAAKNLVPVTLELGGKCPAIIGQGVDLKFVADTIVQVKMMNAGQTCVTADYVLLPAQQAEEFMQLAKAALARNYPALVANPDWARLGHAREWARLQQGVEEAKAAGAEVYTHNPAKEELPEGGRVYPPTLVLDPPPGGSLCQEEIFGPVLPVRTYANLSEAIALVNRGERPLAMHVFSKNKAEVDAILRQTVSGGVTVNGCGNHAIQHNLPFGGVGASGIGVYRGKAGFDRFSHLKPVLYMSPFTKALALLAPPYGKMAERILGFMLHNRPVKEPLPK